MSETALPSSFIENGKRNCDICSQEKEQTEGIRKKRISLSEWG